MAAASVLAWPLLSLATEFNFGLGGENFDAVLNETIVAGVAFRLENPDQRNVGKSDLNPSVCGGVYQSCQGLQRTQIYPAQHLRAAPGAASINFDDGDLNYRRYDITQSPIVWTHDLKIADGNFGFFYRGRAVFDPANYFFTEYHPNRITSQNVNSVGTAGPTGPLGSPSNRYLPRVYGPGGVVRNDRSQSDAHQIGLRYDFLDTNFFGKVAIGEGRDLNFRLGRQTVQWGESTVAILNSINQAQPINANNFYRSGNGLLEDLYVPVNMARVSTKLIENVNAEAYYQFEWKPVEPPTPGTLNSFVDLGTPNLRNNVNASFGSAAEDPELLAGGKLDNPLTLITPTALTIPRYADRKARDQGQYGFKLSYYAEWLNNGTELSAYFMNYHSKLPYLSTYSTNASCARAEGNPNHNNAQNITEFLNDCPNLPLVTPSASSQLGVDTGLLLAQSPGSLFDLGGSNDPASLPGLLALLGPQAGKPNADAVPFDTARIQFEYPEDRKLIGLSFNTTYGDYSYQGEISYRPNLPLQVSAVDLVFAAFGPTLTRCHDAATGCLGTTNTLGFTENGGNNYSLYPSSNFVPGPGQAGYADNFSLVIGAAPGSARSFPNFIIPYRGGVVGENAPNSYIQGWIPGKVLNYVFGATRVLGASENWIGADQVILLYEVAATHVLNLPNFSDLQIEGPGTAYTSASAGADGSGFKLTNPNLPYDPQSNPYVPVGNRKLACSTNQACSYGPDGLRFNPFQARRNQFANAFSTGYRVVARISYESVLPSVSVQPLLIFQHDVYGNAPGPGPNFIEGRVQLNSVFEIRYEKSASLSITYNLYTNGGANNLYRDRDNIGFFLKYQF